MSTVPTLVDKPRERVLNPEVCSVQDNAVYLYRPDGRRFLIYAPASDSADDWAADLRIWLKVHIDWVREHDRQPAPSAVGISHTKVVAERNKLREFVEAVAQRWVGDFASEHRIAETAEELGVEDLNSSDFYSAVAKKVLGSHVR